MPIYEYSCGKCGAHLEVMQKISDKPLSRHARCGGKLTKEWSQTSFQLKGSGWYVTDYAGRKSEAKEGKETKETKSDSSDAKAPEAKPAHVKTPAKESKPAKPSASKAGD